VVFLIVKAVNRLQTMGQKPAEAAPAEPAGPSQEELLAEIRDLLKAR
jgi:large conductance mechanosensitive channel